MNITRIHAFFTVAGLLITACDEGTEIENEVPSLPDTMLDADDGPVGPKTPMPDQLLASADEPSEVVRLPERRRKADDTIRIVGGSDTNIKTVPWQVSVQVRSSGKHWCGGSIVDARWILTAAHCVEGASTSAFSVLAGVTRLSDASSGQRRNITSIRVHPDYDGRSNDIALLKLNSPLNLTGSKARKIRYATWADGPWFNPNVSALVSGWGALESGGPAPNTLQSVEVPILPTPVAKDLYEVVGSPVSDDMLAAGDVVNGGRDACQGDSGGPLVVPSPRGPVVAGVVSWGKDCADRRYPGMYARVATFASWIEGNIGAKNRSQWIVDTNLNGVANIRVDFGTPFDRPLARDFSRNDGNADFGLLHDDDGHWEWLVDWDLDGKAELSTRFGLITDTPVPGKYAAVGHSEDFAVVRAVGRQWQWLVDFDRNGTTNLQKNYGHWWDTPVPADYDGDHRVDFAVLRPIGTQWQWLVDTDRNGVTDIRKNFGRTVDRPVPADYDGDGEVDFAVVRENGSQWQWRVDTDKDGVDEIRMSYGLTSDWPMPADYDGDGKVDFGVLRKVEHQWQWIVDDDHDGTTDARVNYGLHSDLPIVADFDGDGEADITAVRDIVHVDQCHAKKDECEDGCADQLELCKDDPTTTIQECIRERAECDALCDGLC